MPKKLPKISIITPTLNQANFIEQTIKSVLSQNYSDLEYIVVDGGSTDGTLDILKKYRGKLSWISGKDKGQSDAINKGLKMSSGAIVGYLNSDDVLENGALSQIADFFVAHDDIFWVTGKCFIIDGRGRRTRFLVNWYKNIFLKYFRSFATLIITNYISQPATFWKREILENVGLFKTSLHYSMDYDHWLRISKNYKLGFIDTYLASFRIHKTSKTSTKLSQQLAENYSIVQKYSSSNFLVNLHNFHDKTIFFLYNILSS